MADNGTTALLQPLGPSSTEDYTLWSIEKVYVNIEYRVGVTDKRLGFNLEPVYGREIIIALEQKAGSKLPDGVLSEQQFVQQLAALDKILTNHRDQAINNEKKESF